MINRRHRPTELTDSPEHRSIPSERVELRSDDEESNEVILEGYASTFEEYEMYGGPQSYGWIERIDPKAFDITLREKPDLHLLINHAGMPLARTKSGNLDLKADDHGLKVTARLDKRDPEVQSLAVKMERGDMDEMSFAFRVKAQEWRAAPGYEDIDDQSYRTITEISLHKGDVSVVNWGANPNTSVGIRSLPDAIRVLAEADEQELAEIRSDVDVTNMKVAQEKLAALRDAKGPIVENPNVRTDDAEVEETEDEPEEREGVTEAEAPLLDSLIARIAELESLIRVDAAEVEERDEEEEAVDEPVDEARSTKLAEALAAQGILPDGKAPLSVYLAAL